MKWTIDTAHSEVHFKVKHLVISTVSGRFQNFEGSAESSDDSFNEAKVAFSLDVASISTNQSDRDNHLKSGDFFDAEKYPKISFEKGILRKKSDDEYTLEGELTIKNTTKKIQLSSTLGGIMKDPWGNTKVGFEVKGKINRKDFGMEWNTITEAGGMLVGEDVSLEINVQLLKA